MEIDINILNEYHEKGLLYNQTHPEYPLIIWNYSEKVQFENLWDEVTLRCRGMVTDTDGNVIANPMKKFFNIEEGKHMSTPEFDVFEKMDGSLGILFFYNNEWIVATRGSFTSDQALKAKEWLATKYDTSLLLRSYTYMFEIIFKSNKIIVDYGDYEGLVLLGVKKTDTGEEITDYEELDVIADLFGCDLVKKYDGIKDYSILKDKAVSNAEGFVIRFSNGERIKIKFEEYVRLHKIKANLTSTAIWDVVSNGDDIVKFLKDVPDEFYDKINEYIEILKDEYETLDKEIRAEFKNINDKLGTVDQKTFALAVKDLKYSSFFFSLRKGDDERYNLNLWKQIKPKNVNLV